MNVTSLLTRLGNFAPAPLPQPADDKARSPAPAANDAADRFGPAARIGLSDQAQALLSRFANRPAGPASQEAEHASKVRMHRAVAYPLDRQPSPQQLAQVHKIAAKYAYDIRPDATQRMMDELRRQGLHPDQLAREPADGDAAPAGRAAEGRDAEARPPADAAPAAARRPEIETLARRAAAAGGVPAQTVEPASLVA
jgi:hypothetical protein